MALSQMLGSSERKRPLLVATHAVFSLAPWRHTSKGGRAERAHASCLGISSRMVKAMSRSSDSVSNLVPGIFVWTMK